MNRTELIESVVDELLPLGKETSSTQIAIRDIIREALIRYENACMENAVLGGSND